MGRGRPGESREIVEDLTTALAEFTAIAEALERPKDDPTEQ